MPVTQAALVSSGRSTLRGTEARAASWKMQSTPSTSLGDQLGVDQVALDELDLVADRRPGSPGGPC